MQSVERRDLLSPREPSIFRSHFGQQLPDEILLLLQELHTGATFGNAHDATFDFDALLGGQQKAQANFIAYRNIGGEIPFESGAAFRQIDDRRGRRALPHYGGDIHAAAGVLPLVEASHGDMVPQIIAGSQWVNPMMDGYRK